MIYSLYSCCNRKQFNESFKLKLSKLIVISEGVSLVSLGVIAFLAFFPHTSLPLFFIAVPGGIFGVSVLVDLVLAASQCSSKKVENSLFNPVTIQKNRKQFPELNIEEREEIEKKWHYKSLAPRRYDNISFIDTPLLNILKNAATCAFKRIYSFTISSEGVPTSSIDSSARVYYDEATLNKNDKYLMIINIINSERKGWEPRDGELDAIKDNQLYYLIVDGIGKYPEDLLEGWFEDFIINGTLPQGEKTIFVEGRRLDNKVSDSSKKITVITTERGSRLYYFDPSEEN